MFPIKNPIVRLHMANIKEFITYARPFDVNIEFLKRIALKIIYNTHIARITMAFENNTILLYFL